MTVIYAQLANGNGIKIDDAVSVAGGAVGLSQGCLLGNTFAVSARNAADSANLTLLSASSSDHTQLGAATGKRIDFQINAVNVLQLATTTLFQSAVDGGVVLGSITQRFGGLFATDLRISTISGTGSPRAALYQNATEKAYLEWNNGSGVLIVDSDAGITFQPTNTASLLLTTSLLSSAVDGTVVLGSITNRFGGLFSTDLRVSSISGTGSPRMALYQNTTEKTYYEWNNGLGAAVIDSDSLIILQPSNAEAVRFSSTTMLYTSTSFQISSRTSDNSDNCRLLLCGGGGAGNNRGATIYLYGNEHASAGLVEVLAGGTQDIYLETANALRWSVKGASNAGDLVSDSSNGGDLVIDRIGKGIKLKEGANAKMGQATLSGGTITVLNSSVSSTSRILLTGVGTTNAGILSYSVSAGVSFTINSSNASDARVITWLILEAA